MNLISITSRERTWYAYRGECGRACGGRQAKCDCSGHVAVNGSVSAGIGDVTVEGGNGMEECGIGFGVTFEVFHMGENAA